MEDPKLSTEEYYRVLRPGETAKMVGYSTVHLRRLEEAGIFPKRFKLNPNGGPYGACGHYFGVVVGFLQARAAARNSAA